MFEVRMPREIKAYKEKIAFGMTLRQLIFNGATVTIGIVTYVFGKKFSSISNSSLQNLVFCIGCILTVIGYKSKNGLTIEKYIALVLKHSFIEPQKRKFAIEKSLDRIYNIEYQKVVDKLSKLSAKGEK